jgi:hypothetical protein
MIPRSMSAITSATVESKNNWLQKPEEIANLREIYTILDKTELWEVYAGLTSEFVPTFYNEPNSFEAV